MCWEVGKKTNEKSQECYNNISFHIIIFGTLLVDHPSYILNYTQEIKAIIFAHSFRRDEVRGECTRNTSLQHMA